MATNCQSLKAHILEFMDDAIHVTELKDNCVLTLPQKTLDDRLASVFVQQKLPDYYVVHDGGKTAAELFAQGIHITDVKLAGLEEMAERYGATFVQGTFRIGCTASELNAAILAIAQCAVLGTWHVLSHKPSFGEEPVLHHVEAGLRAWQAPYEHDIRPRVRVAGRSRAQHLLDFVSFPRNVAANPIGVKVVRPSDNPLGQVREYGFMAYDLEQTAYADWRRIAVVTRKEDWSDPSLELLRNLASTVEVETGEEDRIERMIADRLSEVAA